MQDPAQGLRPEDLTRFWSWWSTAKDRIAAAIADRSLGRSPLVDEISANVHALHPDIAWELGRGRTAMHNLTVTVEGNLLLRRLTEQWLRSSPPPDQTWEYHASRQASAPMGLEIGGKRFAPDEFRIASSFDESRERFDVVLFHPQFKKSDEKLVRQVLFLTLDECLGEDDVERWIGSIDSAKSAPGGAVPLLQFVAQVAGMRGKATGEQYTLGQGESRDGRPVIVSVNTALKQIDRLEHVFHLTAVIALRQPDGNGLPSSDEAEKVNEAEDRLLAELGDNAVQIGRVTWPGRREIHLFVRDPSAAEAVVTSWSAQSALWSCTHTIGFDPAWTAAKSGIYAALAPRR